MNKIFSAHQISFLPWIGFWKKIYNSDYFDLSIYDQFTKNTWIHYTYIGTKDNKIKWKLPVENEFIIHSFNYSIKDVMVKNNFANDLLQQFYEVHHNDKYFEYIFPLLTEWLKCVENMRNLWIINFVLIQKIYNYLQFNTKLAILPYTNENADVSTKILKQTKMLGCRKYLSGPHGKNYLDTKIFNSNKVEVIFQDTFFLYENYPQSIVSLLSQYGVDFVIKLLKQE